MSAKEKHRCAITGREHSRRDLVLLDTLNSSLEAWIRTKHPKLDPSALVSRSELALQRAAYVEELLTAEKGELTELDREVAQSLASQETLAEDITEEFEERRTIGERLADQMAAFGGSWAFIILFLFLILAWMAVNVILPAPRQFDAYPYILLNLVLSCLAALQAPVIMMSQRRQEAKDRLRSKSDYRVNLKAELEIRHLHDKLDHLISRQWQRLAEIQQLQIEMMEEAARSRRK